MGFLSALMRSETILAASVSMAHTKLAISKMDLDGPPWVCYHSANTQWEKEHRAKLKLATDGWLAANGEWQVANSWRWLSCRSARGSARTGSGRGGQWMRDAGCGWEVSLLNKSVLQKYFLFYCLSYTLPASAKKARGVAGSSLYFCYPILRPSWIPMYFLRQVLCRPVSLTDKRMCYNSYCSFATCTRLLLSNEFEMSLGRIAAFGASSTRHIQLREQNATREMRSPSDFHPFICLGSSRSVPASATLLQLPQSEFVMPGNRTEIETMSHSVSAVIAYTWPANTTVCSGSILNHRWVWSAAHCFKRLSEETSLVKLRFGVDDYTQGATAAKKIQFHHRYAGNQPMTYAWYKLSTKYASVNTCNPSPCHAKVKIRGWDGAIVDQSPRCRLGLFSSKMAPTADSSFGHWPTNCALRWMQCNAM